jgi:hypothetical protein
MLNEIQRIRDRLQQQLNSKLAIEHEHSEELSPCGRYRLVTDSFATVDSPATSDLVVAVVHERETNEIAATILRNDSRLFYAWINRDGHDYLLFPEDLEGQSIVDVTERRIEGFADKDGGFIWTEFHPSPDKSQLAIIGCYWACPYQVTVYDFRDPMNLPLPVIAEFLLPDNNAKFGEWISNDSLSLIDSRDVSHIFEIKQAATG